MKPKPKRPPPKPAMPERSREIDPFSFTAAMKAVTQQLAVNAAAKPRRPKASTRADKKGIVLYVEPQVSKALRRLAIDRETSVQKLGLEALRLLLDRYAVDLPADILPR